MSELPDWARRLDLSPHPEGGWFRETWRSELTVPQSALPPDYAGPRSAGTAILFLLMPGQQSAWHTVRSAELWLYHSGEPAAACRSDPSRTVPQRICSAPTSPQESTRSTSCRRDTGSGHAPATTNPAWSAVWWYRASTSPISRWLRLPTEHFDRCGHQRRVVRRRRTVRQPQRCPPARCAPARRACPRVAAGANNFRRGRAAARAPASLRPSPRLSRSSAVAISPSPPEFDHHPHAVRRHLGGRPRRCRLGVEDARPPHPLPCSAAVRRAARRRVHASSPRRSRATRSTP